MVTYFNLHSPDSERLLADLMKGAPDQKVELVACPISTDHYDGRWRSGEVALEVKHTRRDELIIWQWISGVVIHKSLLDKFRECGFTGYRLKAASVRFRDGGLSDDYRELVVTGWAGVARPESGIRVVKSCPGCHWKKYSGLSDAEQLIDWNQWTGDDFFIVWPMPNYILITERVADLLLNLKIKSFKLQGLQEVNPFIQSTGFTVGRLSNFMPEDLAIKYGRPLGLE